MKTIGKIFAIGSIILLSSGLFAQTPPHPNGGNTPGSGNTPVGGGAPIGSGLIILVSMAVGYGSRKVCNARKSILNG